MSKRKKKGQAPNLPQEVLERARRQAAGEDVDEAPQEVVESLTSSKADSLPADSGNRVNYTKLNRENEEKRQASHVQRMLANPTKIVTEEQMREDYAFVLTDLKNMGMLTVVLMGFMFVLAQFI